MDNLIINETKTTPRIEFLAETGTLTLSGESYPESAMQFYEPVTAWLKEFFASATAENVVMNVKLSYFNTSSSKCLLDLLSLLEAEHRKKRSVTVNWHYRKNDEDMEESGEEFAEDLDMPFKLIAY
jgi:hypothetical protein